MCNDIGEKEGDRKRGSPELEEKKSKAAMQADLFVRHMYSRIDPPSQQPGCRRYLLALEKAHQNQHESGHPDVLYHMLRAKPDVMEFPS